MGRGAASLFGFERATSFFLAAMIASLLSLSLSGPNGNALPSCVRASVLESATGALAGGTLKMS